MKEEEFRKLQINRDQQNLDGKVKRWKQIQPAFYNKPMPKLMWEYLTKTDDMYIDGHFLGVVLLSAALMELILSDQLVSRTQIKPNEIECFKLEKMATLAHHHQILDNHEKDTIDKLRKLRNSLIHANAGKLGNIAKQSYTNYYEGLDSEFYLSPLSDESGIRADALEYLSFMRNLSLKFYGTQQ